jgi:DNA replication protein DnaC
VTRASSELAHLFRALKAPAAARALPKLADRARAEEWSFEQFAAALLKTETDSRDSHGGQARIKAARFPARKTLEEFDFAFQASPRRETVLHLGQLDFLAGKENVVLLGPPGTGKTHPAWRSGSAPAWPATASPCAPPPNGSPCSPTPNVRAAWTQSSPGGSASRC